MLLKLSQGGQRRSRLFNLFDSDLGFWQAEVSENPKRMFAVDGGNGIEGLYWGRKLLP